MKNTKIRFLFLIAMLSLSACVKDNSNEKFNELNAITIEGLETSYETLLGERFIIEPTVKSTDDDLSYVWYLYSASSEGERDTLSMERNLDCVIGGANAIPGDKYTLVYRVTDNKTGVFAYKHMDFTSTSQYSKGLLMLCENDGQVELDIMLPDGSMLNNVYSLNNDGDKLTKNYREVESADPKNTVTPEMKQIYLFADDTDGGVVLDPITLTKTNSVREMFDDEIDTPILNVTQYTGKISMIEYVFLNGKLCKRTTNMHKLLYQASPLVVSNSAKDYSIGGYVYRSSTPILYDDMNGRILVHAPWNKGTLIRANPALSSTTPFDADNMGQYDYVSGGMATAKNYWLLLRDKQTKELVMFKFGLEVKTGNLLAVTPTSKTVLSSAIAPNIGNAIHFVVHNKKISSNCMYVSNNKIYSLNVLMIGGSVPLAEVEIAAPQNVTVTGCEYLSAIVPAPTAEKPNATRGCEQIRLYVQDNNLTSKKGGLIYYEVTTVGGIQAIEYFRRVGGFCDKIIDISEKES